MADRLRMFDLPQCHLPRLDYARINRQPLVVRVWRPHGEHSVPYATNSALPAPVRSHLPEHAQDIFRAAFNHAFAAHEGDPRQEEAAHRIAWAAVKRSHVKVGDRWIERGSLS
jgi:cation transport regulator